jgi:hypothetical protein
LGVLHQVITDTIVVKKYDVHLIYFVELLRFCHHKAASVATACDIRDKYRPDIIRCLIVASLRQFVKSWFNKLNRYSRETWLLNPWCDILAYRN